MNIDILKAELTTDSLARGYSGMSDKEATNDLNIVYRTSNKAFMTGTEVLNAINKVEYDALIDVKKQLVWNILHIGELNPFGLEADLFVDIFGGTSTTITTLKALRKNNISRGQELSIGKVKVGHVEEARKI